MGPVYVWLPLTETDLVTATAECQICYQQKPTLEESTYHLMASCLHWISSTMEETPIHSNGN